MELDEENEKALKPAHITITTNSGKQDDAHARLQPALTEDETVRLNKRRALERKLIMKYDSPSINTRRECYYLIDSKWLNQWSAFTLGVEEQGDSPPGPISSLSLLTVDGKKPLPDLLSAIDYRGVSPLIFYIFTELYGRDESPEICRYAVDIYKPEVPIERLVNIQYKAMKDAKILVNKIRPEWIKWDRYYDDDEEDDNLCCIPCCCCRLTKEHLEAFIFWTVFCCARRKDARKNIKYSQYKPLNGKNDDLDDKGDEVGHRDLLTNNFDHSGHADNKYESGRWIFSLFKR